jgi:ribonuclease P protein component
MARGSHGISRFTPREVQAVFAQGKRYSFSPGLTFVIAPGLKALGRILVVTPRKLGNAIERNTLRRRFKAAFVENNLAAENYDVIVLSRRKVLALTYQQLVALLLAAFAAHKKNV